MKKHRAPDLSLKDIEFVLDELDSWTGRLTWNALIAAAKKRLGYEYSRFTFNSYPEIANAFALKQELFRGQPRRPRSAPKDKQVRAALAQAAREKSRSDRLAAENALLLEQFTTWAINAESRGVTIDMLNAPLPKPNRDQSKRK